ncbi:MAG: hypothetical protein HND53_06920 [Proteobacteria bacterium]|nr:hypothetical protein [Pseudomonadota bacterium]NOG60217.1 hypothetical protein [Pseudomonadota bacterium]
MRHNRYSQRGFSAIMAVVLVVLLALMGGYMATLTSVSSINATVSAGTMQAWFAARSGVEWAIQQVIGAGACIASPTTFNLNGGGTNGYTVVLTCVPTAHTEAGVGAYNVYAITSRASKGTPGSPAYVARQINISVTDAP